MKSQNVKKNARLTKKKQEERQKLIEEDAKVTQSHEVSTNTNLAPVLNWVSESRKPSNTIPLPDIPPTLEFSKLPFQTYKGSMKIRKWCKAILQGIGLILLFFLIPSLVLFVLCIITSMCKRCTCTYRLADNGVMLTFFLSCVKDLIIIVAVINEITLMHLTMRTIFLLVLYTWVIFFCALPFAVRHLAGYHYKFGSSNVGNTRYGSISSNNRNNRNAEEKIKEEPMDKSLANSISSLNDEYPYLKSASTRKDFVFGMTTIVITNLLLVSPLIHESVRLPLMCNDYLQDENITLISNSSSNLHRNITSTSNLCNQRHLPYVICPIVVWFLVSLAFSLWPLYVIFWNRVVHNEWKAFNLKESDDQQTLMNKEPQAMNSWWKVRSSLVLFSDSLISFSSMVGHTFYWSSSLINILISVSLVIVGNSYDIGSNVDTMEHFISTVGHVYSFLIVLVFNIMLFSNILIIHVYYFKIDVARQKSLKLLEAKKANLSYFLACLDSNMQDRILRGKFVLMQEMVSAAKAADWQRTFKIKRYAILFTTTATLGASIWTIKYLIYVGKGIFYR